MTTQASRVPTNRIRYLGRRVFGLTKRPIWQLAYTLTGRRLQATAEYFDIGIFGGYFQADTEAVARRLPPGFECLEHGPGLTELEIWCGEYRHVDIVKPYNELAIFAPVRFTRDGGSAKDGIYPLQMPVTTEEARWGGADTYGFPKILADIVVTEDRGGRICAVRHRGVHVLTLRVDARSVESFEASATILNVRDDGRVIACDFNTAGQRGVSIEPGGVALELGHHAIAEELRRVELRTDEGRALFLPRGRAFLGRGIDVGPLPTGAPSHRTQSPQTVEKQARPA